ncbi:MAG: hypothetical protein AB1424_18820 [Thermodesulfobacteriota bacterium]
MSRPRRSDPPPYLNLLEQLKTCFPVPISNPVMDCYFVHTLSQFLDRVDGLKSGVPILGPSSKVPYQNLLGEKFPEKRHTVEEVTRLLVEYCQGMPIWAHPNAQVNVVPPHDHSQYHRVCGRGHLQPQPHLGRLFGPLRRRRGANGGHDRGSHRL